ncbi:hypothetical protein CL634_09610 [bacterium]|nr:hypothetical protein [bacterium]
MIELKINNPNALPKMHKDLEDAFQEGIKQGMQAIGMHLVNVIKKDIKKKSPNSTRGKRRGKNVWVSPAGESPNNDTGGLTSSMMYELMGNNDEVLVGTTLNYGRYLEEGTSKMAQRPYIKKNALEQEDRMAEILTESIQKQIERMGRG